MWGFVHATCLMTPSSLTFLVASYSAAKEWCAVATWAPHMRTSPPTTTPSVFAITRPPTPCCASTHRRRVTEALPLPRRVRRARVGAHSREQRPPVSSDDRAWIAACLDDLAQIPLDRDLVAHLQGPTRPAIPHQGAWTRQSHVPRGHRPIRLRELHIEARMRVRPLHLRNGSCDLERGVGVVLGGKAMVSCKRFKRVQKKDPRHEQPEFHHRNTSR